MAELKNWPWILNQPGYEYPAELVRAQHYDATSGGNGVGSPTAMKVTAQPAPDGTVSILPGGATAVSTYAGADGQSYHAQNFQPFMLDVPPTGSSAGGRHDLVILRVCDPQYDEHPEHGGGPISAEEAANYDFWWYELHQGKPVRLEFDFPHVKLAHIRRGPNQTIVRPEDIHDIRELANPKNRVHMFARNLYLSEQQSLHSAERIWPQVGTHTVHIPEFATRLHLQASWGTVRSHEEAGSGRLAQGWVQVHFVHPDGDRLIGQQASWNTSGDQNRERFNIVLGDQRPIPEKFRGEDVTVEFRGRKTNVGPNIYMDGDSSISLITYFEQGVL